MFCWSKKGEEEGGKREKWMSERRTQIPHLSEWVNCNQVRHVIQWLTEWMNRYNSHDSFPFLSFLTHFSHTSTSLLTFLFQKVSFMSTLGVYQLLPEKRWLQLGLEPTILPSSPSLPFSLLSTHLSKCHTEPRFRIQSLKRITWKLEAHPRKKEKERKISAGIHYRERTSGNLIILSSHPWSILEKKTTHNITWTEKVETRSWMKKLNEAWLKKLNEEAWLNADMTQLNTSRIKCSNLMHRNTDSLPSLPAKNEGSNTFKVWPAFSFFFFLSLSSIALHLTEVSFILF